MQAVLQASGKRFKVDTQAGGRPPAAAQPGLSVGAGRPDGRTALPPVRQGDPVAFLTWLLHELHTALGGGKRFGSSVIDASLQGRVRSVAVDEAGAEGEEESTPFYLLGLDLPPPPLFQDVMEKNIIPQVPLLQAGCAGCAGCAGLAAGGFGNGQAAQGGGAEQGAERRSGAGPARRC